MSVSTEETWYDAIQDDPELQHDDSAFPLDFSGQHKKQFVIQSLEMCEQSADDDSSSCSIDDILSDIYHLHYTDIEGLDQVPDIDNGEQSLNTEDDHIAVNALL